jgi:ADP-ribosyl-[dinitrogen reductase] hydrolase
VSPGVVTVERGERVRGCLLGLALGDALGAPVEFASVAAIDERFGPEGVRDLVPWGGHPAGAFTDDTQMALATAAGLLRAGPSLSIDPAPFVVAEYVRWYEMQLCDPDSVRAPGTTCLAACASLAADPTPRPAANDSCGCGAVMRMAPAGCAGRRPAFGLGAWLGALTHGHPSGFLSAGYLAEAVAAIVAGAALWEALAAADDALRTVPCAADGWPLGGGWPAPAAGDRRRDIARDGPLRWSRPRTAVAEGRKQVAEAVAAARAGAVSGASDRAAVAALGGGWTGHQALAIAVLCSLRHGDDWMAAAAAAADHGGDSDSTACITGALLGALHGAGQLPAAWLEQLEDRPRIEALADSLAALPMAGGAPS